MKTLFVLRHAQAKDGSIFEKDKERKLTNTGIQQISSIAQNFINNTTIVLDYIITSNATRTLLTAKAFAQATNIINIQANALLYNAPLSVFYDIIVQIPSNIHSVLIVAHNPGITHFVNSLGIVNLDNMPTSGLFGINVDCLEWRNFKNAKKDFLYFDYPKMV